MSYIFGYTYETFCSLYHYLTGNNVDEDAGKVYFEYKKMKNEDLLNEIIQEIQNENVNKVCSNKDTRITHSVYL